MSVYKLVTIGMAVLVVSTSLTWAGVWEVQAGAEAFIPSKSFWDKAYGAEVKAIYWQESDLGLALGTGLSQWDVDDSADAVVSNPGSYERLNGWQGDVRYIPLGLSVLKRQELNLKDDRDLAWQLEGGIRYMIASAQVDLIETERVWVNPGQIRETHRVYPVDYENGWVGRLGASLRWGISEPLSLLFTGGYQFDLSKGKVKAQGLAREENIDLAAFYLQIGLAYRW